ncbi:MAG: FtsH protease activity modulator HflK [Spirochaetaceae bacterium]|jgi:membrane protease subunit HflK|nr:FtsH protease activity modulator HflK [Spirochaetaceae bacterium]
MRNVSPKPYLKWLKPTSVILVVGCIIVLVFLGTSVYIVDQTENAVVTRFGRFLKINEPGLHFQLPFGIDKHYVINVTAYNTEQFGFNTVKSGIATTYSNRTSESTMLTGDLNIIDVEWIIQYRIVDPRAWVFNVNEREQTIRDVSRSVVNMLVGDRGIMDIMGPERSAIENSGVALMNETFRSYGLGIDVVAVKLQNIDPPAGVQEAFDDVNKAEQDMNRLINEGQQAYNAAIPRARGEADRRIQVAQGYATERINNANGEVDRFNAVHEEYRKAPEVTRQRLYYEMIEEIFNGGEDAPPSVIIDRSLQNFVPFRDMGKGE